MRYTVARVSYVTLAADPYPGFAGRAGSYPIDVDIDPPGAAEPLGHRLPALLALPAILLADAMLGSAPARFGGYATQAGGIASTVAFFAWFVCIGRARMPTGFRDALAYTIGYSAQVTGYLLLLTDRLPEQRPGRVTSPPRRSARTRSASTSTTTCAARGSPRSSACRSRFRTSSWLGLWRVVGLVRADRELVRAAVPRPAVGAVHRFVARLVRYQTHVYAFAQLVANPFPGFTGRRGSYPIEVELPGPEPSRAWSPDSGLILAIPALLIAGAIGERVVLIAAVYTWFYALVRGRAPAGPS